MKNIKTIAKGLFLLATATFLLFACSDKDAAPLGDPKELLVQTNAEEFARLIAAREKHEGSIFEIKALKREGNILKVTVEGPGGVDNYKVVWSGILLESYPMQTGIVVAYSRLGEVQHEAIMTHELTIDLQELFGPNIDPKDVTVNVSNGSQPIDSSIDPNGTVSSK
ncbi:hypothetical protein [Dyadobacter pollutisoli]|jgi:hypothetical protein|uniref:Uncharacterized protein n=1 Tax=Dyadobacter pollutisoli TaxID=2910158 RepID=A0A9E8SNA8_9BACT|nr:hypothetical protein [Dyadobacter pollutisoli]WAC14114.1 hypothetical protein ON006_09145 [Dyadobacter pollutisoli]